MLPASGRVHHYAILIGLLLGIRLLNTLNSSWAVIKVLGYSSLILIWAECCRGQRASWRQELHRRTHRLRMSTSTAKKPVSSGGLRITLPMPDHGARRRTSLVSLKRVRAASDEE
jgi:hypothetical protein